MVPPTSKSTENPNTAQDISNHHSASLAADNDDREVDHSTTTLAANIELSRNRCMLLQSILAASFLLA